MCGEKLQGECQARSGVFGLFLPITRSVCPRLGSAVSPGETYVQFENVIIRRATDGLLFITQTDHAALAARIMAQWHALRDHPRREAILAATHNHDDGWREEDAMLHVSRDGEPLDFTAVPAEVKQRIWPRAAERLAAQIDPYVGALVAQHALTVHAPLRDNPQWRRFFATMERTRDALRSRAAVAGAECFDDDYAFVRIGDQLSLIFCNGWTAPLAGIGYRAILNGITLEVRPDPFAGVRVPLAIHARSLPARTYTSADDVRAAYADAPVIALEGYAAAPI